MEATDLFRTYLDRFTSGDIAGAAELLTDDFRFHGPMLTSEGKAAFLAGSAQLGPIMRGFRMHRQWQDGDQVCSFYDFNIQTPAGAGSIPMAEWNTVRDGKLASARLIFDTAAMAALMPAT
ncbi:nuclear transport factor 2 family protein [Catenulispora sp. GP43]|uniref:nuclear transport factor 2 family protein n=1 Tax=Catenulispora sp. GP43 TaxID=3156263 RepID=UPI0035158666